MPTHSTHLHKYLPHHYHSAAAAHIPAAADTLAADNTLAAVLGAHILAVGNPAVHRILAEEDILVVDQEA